MVQKRQLPKRTNPLLGPDDAPPLIELVERRRLGQTNLAVKPNQVNSSSATKAKNLGVFDYAHLRAPLPRDLQGSEIFIGSTPESYFLMQRSSDGYISATGMFKASFPWATLKEEDAERKYIKSLSTTSSEETAGNIWIPPTHALQVSEEYNIRVWIEALLHSDRIETGSNDPLKHITPPPKFILPAAVHALPPPAVTPTPKGSRRAGSPAKGASPRKIASPRKRNNKTTALAHANAASANLQSALDNAASVADSEAESEFSTNGEIKGKVVVDSVITTNGDVETNETKVSVELPSGAPTYPSEMSAEEMITAAKEMVAEATKENGALVSRKTKRKAESDLEADGEAKRRKSKVLEQTLRKERVKTRALIGLSASLVIGAIIPYVL